MVSLPSGNRSVSECQSRGQVVTSAGDVRGSSVQYTVTDNTADDGWRFYTAWAVILHAAIATDWRMKVSKNPSVCGALLRRRKSERDWGEMLFSRHFRKSRRVCIGVPTSGCAALMRSPKIAVFGVSWAGIRRNCHRCAQAGCCGPVQPLVNDDWIEWTCTAPCQ
jgi:hypothetical protein